jgi:hypothetical protein
VQFGSADWQCSQTIQPDAQIPLTNRKSLLRIFSSTKGVKWSADHEQGSSFRERAPISHDRFVIPSNRRLWFGHPNFSAPCDKGRALTGTMRLIKKATIVLILRSSAQKI